MRSLYRAAGILLCCLWIGVSPCFRVLAANDDEVKLLMQKGLTVFEIDQELARIQLEENSIIQQTTIAEQELQQQLIRSDLTKQHAAKVLRAYYMGDRDSLWMLLFTISSFKDAISTLDYLQMIIRNDHETLKRHSDNQQQLTTIKQSLAASQADLQQTKERYLSQREQMVRIQSQIDEELALLPQQNEAALILQQMTQLTLLWQEKGIPLFKTYFQALAIAMKQLPEIISADGNDITKHLIINGFQYTFQITDGELNEFLRSKNPIFENMNFRFTDTEVITAGTQEGVDISIKGKYSMATKEEGDGKAFIRFTITELQFNGYGLPQSTIEAMEQEFDLGVYPQNLAPFLSVTGLKLQVGKLSIILKMSF